MPAKFRLSRADFMKMRGFKRAHGALFSLSYGVIPDRTRPGAACVISGKVIRTAVARNRVKRAARSTLAPILKGLKSPLVLVVYAKKSASSAKRADLDQDIEKLVSQVL